MLYIHFLVGVKRAFHFGGILVGGLGCSSAPRGNPLFTNMSTYPTSTLSFHFKLFVTQTIRF